MSALHQTRLQAIVVSIYLLEVSRVSGGIQIAAKYGYNLRVCVCVERFTVIYLQHIQVQVDMMAELCKLLHTIVIHVQYCHRQRDCSWQDVYLSMQANRANSQS